MEHIAHRRNASAKFLKLAVQAGDAAGDRLVERVWSVRGGGHARVVAAAGEEVGKAAETRLKELDGRAGYCVSVGHDGEGNDLGFR